MTRKNISWEELQSKLARGAVRKRTARRWYQRQLAAYVKTPEYARLKQEKAANQLTENTTDTKDEA